MYESLWGNQDDAVMDCYRWCITCMRVCMHIFRHIACVYTHKHTYMQGVACSGPPTMIHTHTHMQGLSKPWSWPHKIQLAECEVMRIFAVLWQLIIFAPTINDVRHILNKFATMRASLVRTTPAMGAENSRVSGTASGDFSSEMVVVTAREEDASMFDDMLMGMIERIGEHNAKGGACSVCVCVRAFCALRDSVLVNMIECIVERNAKV
jgi:hypothetical protein